METSRQVVVLDAADIAAVSAFWAGVLGGRVVEDDDLHSVIDAEGEWRMGVQYAPDHVAPDWPAPDPGQRLHLDLWVLSVPATSPGDTEHRHHAQHACGRLVDASAWGTGSQ